MASRIGAACVRLIRAASAQRSFPLRRVGRRASSGGDSSPSEPSPVAYESLPPSDDPGGIAAFWPGSVGGMGGFFTPRTASPPSGGVPCPGWRPRAARGSAWLAWLALAAMFALACLRGTRELRTAGSASVGGFPAVGALGGASGGRSAAALETVGPGGCAAGTWGSGGAGALGALPSARVGWAAEAAAAAAVASREVELLSLQVAELEAWAARERGSGAGGEGAGSGPRRDGDATSGGAALWTGSTPIALPRDLIDESYRGGAEGGQAGEGGEGGVEPGAVPLGSVGSATSPAPRLLIAVLSAKGSRRRREVVRRTWARPDGEWEPEGAGAGAEGGERLPGGPGAAAPPRGSTAPGLERVMIRFVLYESERDEAIAEEARRYGDIVFLRPQASDASGYRSIVHKVLALVGWAAAEVGAEAVLKTDDDAYVDVGAVLRDLRARCPAPGACAHARLYLGEEKRHGEVITEPTNKWANLEYVRHTGLRQYFPYMFGGGYLFSLDVARVMHLTNQIAPLKALPNEDATFGFWVSGLHLQRVHHPLVRGAAGPATLYRMHPSESSGRWAGGHIRSWEDLCSGWLVLHKAESAGIMWHQRSALRLCARRRQVLDATRALAAGAGTGTEAPSAPSPPATAPARLAAAPAARAPAVVAASPTGSLSGVLALDPPVAEPSRPLEASEEGRRLSQVSGDVARAKREVTAAITGVRDARPRGGSVAVGAAAADGEDGGGASRSAASLRDGTLPAFPRGSQTLVQPYLHAMATEQEAGFHWGGSSGGISPDGRWLASHRATGPPQGSIPRDLPLTVGASDLLASPDAGSISRTRWPWTRLAESRAWSYSRGAQARWVDLLPRPPGDATAPAPAGSGPWLTFLDATTAEEEESLGVWWARAHARASAGEAGADRRAEGGAAAAASATGAAALPSPPRRPTAGFCTRAVAPAGARDGDAELGPTAGTGNLAAGPTAMAGPPAARSAARPLCAWPFAVAALSLDGRVALGVDPRRAESAVSGEGAIGVGHAGRPAGAPADDGLWASELDASGAPSTPRLVVSLEVLADRVFAEFGEFSGRADPVTGSPYPSSGGVAMNSDARTRAGKGEICRHAVTRPTLSPAGDQAAFVYIAANCLGEDKRTDAELGWGREAGGGGHPSPSEAPPKAKAGEAAGTPPAPHAFVFTVRLDGSGLWRVPVPAPALGADGLEWMVEGDGSGDANDPGGRSGAAEEPARSRDGDPSCDGGCDPGARGDRSPPPPSWAAALEVALLVCHPRGAALVHPRATVVARRRPETLGRGEFRACVAAPHIVRGERAAGGVPGVRPTRHLAVETLEHGATRRLFVWDFARGDALSLGTYRDTDWEGAPWELARLAPRWHPDARSLAFDSSFVWAAGIQSFVVGVQTAAAWAVDPLGAPGEGARASSIAGRDGAGGAVVLDLSLAPMDAAGAGRDGLAAPAADPDAGAALADRAPGPPPARPASTWDPARLSSARAGERVVPRSSPVVALASLPLGGVAGAVAAQRGRGGGSADAGGSEAASGVSTRLSGSPADAVTAAAASEGVAASSRRRRTMAEGAATRAEPAPAASSVAAGSPALGPGRPMASEAARLGSVASGVTPGAADRATALLSAALMHLSSLPDLVDATDLPSLDPILFGDGDREEAARRGGEGEGGARGRVGASLVRSACELASRLGIDGRACRRGASSGGWAGAAADGSRPSADGGARDGPALQPTSVAEPAALAAMAVDWGLVREAAGATLDWGLAEAARRGNSTAPGRERAPTPVVLHLDLPAPLQFEILAQLVLRGDLARISAVLVRWHYGFESFQLAQTFEGVLASLGVPFSYVGGET